MDATVDPAAMYLRHTTKRDQHPPQAPPSDEANALDLPVWAPALLPFADTNEARSQKSDHQEIDTQTGWSRPTPQRCTDNHLSIRGDHQTLTVRPVLSRIIRPL